MKIGWLKIAGSKMDQLWLLEKKLGGNEFIVGEDYKYDE